MFDVLPSQNTLNGGKIWFLGVKYAKTRKIHSVNQISYKQYLNTLYKG